jgi:predicted unusual protein kinase regulating ubiquinone biosynthesis (AarF/ABC1/UbiB family)
VHDDPDTTSRKSDLSKEDHKDKDFDQSTMAVPSGRGSRLARLGWMATGIAGSMMAEGARQLAQGNRPKMSSLLLTPANARRVADQLAKLRGAAMKVGQLVSMETGDLLPPVLAEILARLRSDARAMPKSQVTSVLEASWGKGWERQFKHFSYTPLAAASIGQVHRAQTRDGRDLAIKIQYPGVRESIDSDVDNVAGLLRLSGLLTWTSNLCWAMPSANCMMRPITCEKATTFCDTGPCC